MKINGVELGLGRTMYKIAELSANHNGSIEHAKNTMLAAKSAGADAVKLQTYTADTLTINCDNDEFILKGGTWNNAKLYDLYKKAHTPYEWHSELFSYAKKIGITCFSTPFDKTAVELLESFDVPAYKIASFEIVDHPLIEEVSRTGKPLLISTGGASELEIAEALEVARSSGAGDILLFHCISAYPAKIEDSNLLSIKYLRKQFGVEVGLSDHTIGPLAAVLALGQGAVALEKHFILDRKDEGPDSSFSIEPAEFSQMVCQINHAQMALGEYSLKRSSAEHQSQSIRKSIYFIKDLSSGTVITSDHIKVIRPGNGLHPKYYKTLLGSTLSTDVNFGQATSFSHFKVDFEEPLKLFSFVDVDYSHEHVEILYELLKDRTHSISHKELPNLDDHSNFVKNNPYRAWYIVYMAGEVLGSVYVQHDNSVGIHIDTSKTDLSFEHFYLELTKKLQPLPERASKISKYFFFNVAPNNKNLAKWLIDGGALISQNSYVMSTEW